MNVVIGAVVILGIFSASVVSAKTLRFSSATGEEIKSFMEGESDDSLQFVAGDTLPLTVTIDGDILQSKPAVATPVEVKRGFFLRMDGDQLRISWDGVEYVPLADAIGGRLGASASGSPTAKKIELSLSAFAKP